MRHTHLAWASLPQHEIDPWAKSKYNGKSVETIIDEINKEVESSRCHTCILSAEEFSLYNPAYFSRVLNGLSGQVKIVIYLRNQADLIESMYRQLVKGKGIKETFDEFLQSALHRNAAGNTPLNFHEFLQKWSAIAGENNIVVREYKSATDFNSVNDFLKTIGSEIVADRTDSRSANLSLHGPYLEFMRSMNGVLEVNKRAKLIAELQTLSASHPCPKKPLLDPSQRKEIEELYASQNAEVYRRYMKNEQEA